MQDIYDNWVTEQTYVDKYGIKKKRKSVYKYKRHLPKIESSRTVCMDTQEGCCICLKPMLSNRLTTFTKLKCGHVFDTVCIKTWAKQSPSCPSCRDVITLKV